MKHYLDLVSVSARVHRRQSRLTRLCIVLSVFLITGIFGMADMEIRSMTQRTILEQGAWHVAFPGLNDRQQSLIAQRAEVKLGVHHALHRRKNFLLMTGSFAFSIILFLGFSPTLDLMQNAIKPMQPYTPDASVLSKDNSCTVPKVLAQQISALPFVERVFGRSFAYDLPAQVAGTETSVMLVSFEENQFGWAEDMVKKGDLQTARNGAGVLLLDKEGSGYQPGDTVMFDTPQGTRSFSVAATLIYTPFADSSDTVICSESLFTASLAKATIRLSMCSCDTAKPTSRSSKFGCSRAATMPFPTAC